MEDKEVNVPDDLFDQQQWIHTVEGWPFVQATGVQHGLCVNEMRHGWSRCGVDIEVN